MKHPSLCTLTSVVCLLLACLLLSGCSLLRQTKATAVTNTHDVRDAFSDISVSCSECDVKLLPATDGACTVVCREAEQIPHAVEVRSNTLYIERQQTKKNLLIINIPLVIEIYLPQKAYDRLTVSTSSGSIDVAADFTFDSATLKSSSGAIRVAAAVTGDLTANTSSGAIYMEQTSPAALTLESSSGSIHLDDVRGGAADLTSSSGDVKLTDTVLSGALRVHTSSGDVTLSACDAASISIRTSSGNVSGTLRSAKDFRTQTSSGSVSVPDAAGTDPCEIHTSSGNIRITLS